MRKVYTAFALLALLIGAGITEYRIAVSSADDILTVAEQAQHALDSGDDKATIALCRKAAEQWNSRKPALQLFLPHGTLAEADITADQLILYAEAGDKTNTAAELHEFCDRMRAIKADEKISIYNLF